MTPSPNYYPELFCQNCDEMGGSFYYDERTETSLCSDCKIKEATQNERDRIIKIIDDKIDEEDKLQSAIVSREDISDDERDELNFALERSTYRRDLLIEVKDEILKEADHE